MCVIYSSQNTMKKIILSSVIWALWMFVGTATFAQGWSSAQWWDFTTQTQSAQGINIKWSGTQSAAEGGGLIQGVKNIINYALMLLSLIALVVLLYAWFRMVTAAWDTKQYDEWFTILKQAAVWLIFIGTSWLIVSFIFWIIGRFTQST